MVSFLFLFTCLLRLAGDGSSSILLAPSVLAVTNIELAAYNQRLNLTVGDKLPKPLEIT